MPYDPLAWERRLYLVQTKTQRVPGERLDVRFSCFLFGVFSRFWFARSTERTGSTGRHRSPVFIFTGLSLCINISANNHHHSIPTANCRHSWVPAGALLKQPRPLRAGRVAHTHIYRATTTSKGRKRQSHRLLVIPPLLPTEPPPTPRHSCFCKSVFFSNLSSALTSSFFLLVLLT